MFIKMCFKAVFLKHHIAALTHNVGRIEPSRNSFFLKAFSISSRETIFNLCNNANADCNEIKLMEIIRFSESRGTFKGKLKLQKYILILKKNIILRLYINSYRYLIYSKDLIYSMYLYI